MRWRAVYIASLCLLMTLGTRLDERPPEYAHIFKIEIKHCVGFKSDSIRIQTGFRIKGKPGIYTALHGVAGCTSITAYQAQGPQDFYDLKIEEVDIERDVALLTSREVQSASAEGLRKASEDPALRDVRTVGYPRAFKTALPTEDLSLRYDGDIYRNWGETTSGIITRLNSRGSPSTSVRMLDIEGHLLPGHSGAPILTKRTNKVVGIGIGGLKGGADEISLATPIWDVVLVPLQSVLADYNRLKGKDASVLFSMEEYVDTAILETIATAPDVGAGLAALGTTPGSPYVHVLQAETATLAAFRWSGTGEALEGIGDPVAVGAVDREQARFLVSPDGRHLYVKANEEGALALLSFDEERGALTALDTFEDDRLAGAVSMALSPDGKHLYASRRTTCLLAAFERDVDTGRIRFANDYDLEECEPVDQQPDAMTLTMAEDGTNLYVVDQAADRFWVYARQAQDGSLRFPRSYTSAALNIPRGLTSVASTGSAGPVYVTTRDEQAVVLLQHDASGSLAQRDIYKKAVPDLPATHRPVRVSITPDGASVLVVYAGEEESLLAAFERDAATGVLQYRNSIDGLADAPRLAIADFSFKGTHVYTGVGDGTTVDVLRLKAPTHELSLTRGERKAYKDVTITYKGITRPFDGRKYVVSVTLRDPAVSGTFELSRAEEAPACNDTVGICLQLIDSNANDTILLKLGEEL